MRLHYFSLQSMLPYLQFAGYVVHLKDTVLAWCSQIQLHSHKDVCFIQEQNVNFKVTIGCYGKDSYVNCMLHVREPLILVIFV